MAVSMACSPKIVIIGPGVVGKTTGYLFENVNFLDKDSDGDNVEQALYRSEYIILCLPTPTEKGKQNTKAIEVWLDLIEKTKDDVCIIIRSTVLPKTCEALVKKYHLKIAHVPEFLTESTALYDTQNPELLVIGADDIIFREKVFQLFNNRVRAKRVIQCDLTTAETIKYAMNAFFSLKVVFANEVWDLAKEVGAKYEKIKEALESHKWGSKNGWDVWNSGYRGFSGKCLPKDLEALVNFADMPLMEKVQEINNKLLKTAK